MTVTSDEMEQRRLDVLARYDWDEDRALAPCEREAAVAQALGLTREAPPMQRWTDAVHHALALEMPADIRQRIATALPLPATVEEAQDELDYWREREADMLAIQGPQYEGQALDVVAELRRVVVRDHLAALQAPPLVGSPAVELSPDFAGDPVALALLAEPTASDRAISRRCGCSPTTVGTRRAALGLAAAVRTATRGGKSYPMRVTG